MCGLVGFLNGGQTWHEARFRPTLNSMAESLRHRGPDDQGIWYDAAGQIGLAHRRLSIYAFASEIKALWRFPGFKPTLNLAALGEYSRYSYIADHLSVFNEVSKIMPGIALEIRRDAPAKTHCHWSLSEAVEKGPRSRIIA